MKKLFLTLALALFLAGCATSQQSAPAPQVTVTGPLFASGDFDCGKRPLPPNPAALDAKRQGSAAAHYEGALRTWGQHCQNKLSAVSSQLGDAGQLVDGSRK